MKNIIVMQIEPEIHKIPMWSWLSLNFTIEEESQNTMYKTLKK